MSLALYRKYRSRSLSEIVGQDHVTTLLKRAIEQDKVAHAYLFTGPRGVGKTSIARILAHEINELTYTDESSHLDIIEIDAASNNGVEDIRDLRDRVQIAPTSAKRKIYIIDEVHMLSKQAFNALLKTLEEPPEHVVFILATTDLDKVPDTILSRTQRHTFRRATEQDIIKNLKRIASAEKAAVDDDAYELIAKHADGSFRDSVSLFDQLLSGSASDTLTMDAVSESLGLASTNTIEKLLSYTKQGDIAAIDATLRELEANGVPTRTTCSQLLQSLRAHIATDASVLPLLDKILDVSKSQHPELKLLSVLGTYASGPIPAAPAPELQSPVVTPSQPAQYPKPATLKTSPKTVTPEPKKALAKQVSKPTSSPDETTATPEIAFTRSDSPFDWAFFVEHVRKNHVAMYSVLSKCEPELDGNDLKLYTKSAFYKKKLDDTKYRLLMNSSLKELGYAFDVETIAEAKPLKDSQAARVAAIMGGGEEVSVSDA